VETFRPRLQESEPLLYGIPESMGHALEAHSHPLECFFVPGPLVHEEEWLASAQGEDLLQEAHGFQVRPSRGDPENENLPRVDIDCGQAKNWRPQILSFVSSITTMPLRFIWAGGSPLPSLRYHFLTAS